MKDKKKNADKLLPERKLLDWGVRQREIKAKKNPTRWVAAYETVNLFKDMSESDK